MKMGRLPGTSLILLALGVSIALAPPAVAQGAQPKVADIRSNPTQFLNEKVALEGFVTQYVEARAQTTAFYMLKDDWGGVIRVRTSLAKPAVGHRYRMSGVVGFDPEADMPYVAEEERVDLSLAPPPAATPPVESAAPRELPAESGRTLRTPLVLAAVGIVLLGAAAAFWIVASGRRRGGEAPRTADFSVAASVPADAPPPPQEVIEGKTIKIHAPPPGTVKLMPGWFEVVSGDDVVTQIRFYKLKGDAGETTFGRAAGRPYAHVQLKPMTVSSRQAKVSFDAGQARLTNFASADSNPTTVNGRELGVDEAAVLSEGDVVAMGEVHFKFHAS
jgi:hypothetical protein